MKKTTKRKKFGYGHAAAWGAGIGGALGAGYGAIEHSANRPAGAIVGGTVGAGVGALFGLASHADNEYLRKLPPHERARELYSRKAEHHARMVSSASKHDSKLTQALGQQAKFQAYHNAPKYRAAKKRKRG